jgi:hypothetical protein
LGDQSEEGERQIHFQLRDDEGGERRETNEERLADAHAKQRGKALWETSNAEADWSRVTVFAGKHKRG